MSFAGRANQAMQETLCCNSVPSLRYGAWLRAFQPARTSLGRRRPRGRLRRPSPRSAGGPRRRRRAGRRRSEMALAARRSVVVRGWILDTEEVMQDGPDVVLTVMPLALADVQDHDTSRLHTRLRGRHRERQPEAESEVDTAHGWLERSGQPVRPELRSAWIAPELVIHALAAVRVCRLVLQARSQQSAPQIRVRRSPAHGVQDRRASGTRAGRWSHPASVGQRWRR
jgi:hypothetical protein